MCTRQKAEADATTVRRRMSFRVRTEKSELIRAQVWDRFRKDGVQYFKRASRLECVDHRHAD